VDTEVIIIRISPWQREIDEVPERDGEIIVDRARLSNPRVVEDLIRNATGIPEQIVGFLRSGSQ
jgi:hypothetical protein